MKNYRVWKVLQMVAVGILAVLLFGFVTMQLWNWLMPVLFGMKPVTFAQALGLIVLGKILFGGIHRHGGRGRGWPRHMQERWAEMSPEERERFRTGMRGRRGCRPGASSEPASGQSSF